MAEALNESSDYWRQTNVNFEATGLNIAEYRNSSREAWMGALQVALGRDDLLPDQRAAIEANLRMLQIEHGP